MVACGGRTHTHTQTNIERNGKRGNLGRKKVGTERERKRTGKELGDFKGRTWGEIRGRKEGEEKDMEAFEGKFMSMVGLRRIRQRDRKS